MVAFGSEQELSPLRVQLPELHSRGLLVVDDSALQRASAVQCLRNLGLDTIYEAGDGYAALKVLAETSPTPAVMLLDLELPGLDGIEVLQHLQGASECPGIILLSSSDQVLINAVATMAEAMGIRLLGAHRKPITAERLYQTLQSFNTNAAPAAPIASERPAPTRQQLHQALLQGEIIPHYQPKISLQQPRLIGWEALARWNSYSPAEFIPLAEQEGLISQLTLSLLEQVLRDIRRWERAGISSHVAINLSATSLVQAELAGDIIQRVNQAGINPRQLSFEITESALVLDLPLALATISRLRLKGFGFSIDDYGTGFSSLQQLSRFPFTELKIDRSFVQGATRQPHVREILQSAVDMGRRMGITSVAEGVETLEQLHLLRTLGCRQAQGFLLAKPMPAEQVGPWLEQELARVLALFKPQVMEASPLPEK